ncbi:DUF3239 domain-containing protein [Antrihabitans sp. YC2-6]|uniref:DUF3239 domain-containing protein n=1 Tax=Antrihabitans sp. YC2-6 TaxID=2799498 RepID=UPI0018F4E690|nr:DUF3239 domain-containing protein [Antrihabitans sp. YC2-6]MBJ8344222.1 DUF3239 domain-containing protein [Antrihabitans sp. YC2-6]
MRRFEFVVDRAHAMSANEIMADVRRLRVVALVSAIGLGAVAALLISIGHPWSFIIAVVLAIGSATALWVAIWAPRRVGSVEKLYAESALVPAMIAETRADGVTLLALIDIGKPAGKYALVAKNVRRLPGHPVETGERVPAVSVVLDRTARAAGDTWQVVNPMPIAWGTADTAVIEDARNAIVESEWALVAAHLELVAKVRKNANHRLLLENKDLPDHLR